MASDQRWTGGLANREWQRGSKPAGRVIDADRLSWDVRRYLADCRAHSGILSPRYHPTEAGALKAVYHRGREEEDVIRGEFAQQAGTGDG
jgi:hypothetical protein